ncbi:DUF4153 domain-containing protein [Dokdonia sinensis]|uniref:DUF4153 domain-containing protein n=1 Tax=Dokdonia sinensis TaxID=2479847 RepID=A0A3M0G4X8_9FLAO|nr:DUF4153 domain-containing protein [Dokdonia sinensis]RMB59107.1 DUF4153 domain-containing protein [Dokdonia sinensis]
MKLFSLSEFSRKATEAFKRFPFTLVWAIVSAVITIILVDPGERAFERHGNLILIFVLGISWLIGAQFYIEQFKKKTLWWIKIVVIGLLIALYFTLPEYEVGRFDTDDTPYIRWTLYFIAGHLALFFAPFITVWHPKAYWNYLSNIIIAIARSALFSGVLYLGLVLAMLAVQFLFEIDIDGIRYFQLFIICLGIVNTWVYLSDFPKEIQHDIRMEFHKPVEVFVKFILIPLAGLYVVILYAYAIKILALWELPKGWVSYLIIALATLLFIIQIIIHPVRLSHSSRLIRKFQPAFYWAMLPLLFLFYVAIYRRIADYGVTEARYFLVLIAVFITGATLYLIFSRKQQLRFLPMALAVMAMVGSFGFWGAFSVSERSQLEQFEEVYNAFAKADSTTLSRETADRFVSITRYLSDRNTLDKTESTLGYNPKVAFPDARSWNMGDKILDSLGLKISLYNQNPERLAYYNDEANAYVVSGYDYIKDLYLNKQQRHNNPENIIQGYRFSLEENSNAIQVTKDQEQVLSISLDTVTAELRKNGGNNGSFDSELIYATGNNDSIAVKVYFKQLELVKEDTQFQVAYCNVMVLFKLNK